MDVVATRDGDRGVFDVERLCCSRLDDQCVVEGDRMRDVILAAVLKYLWWDDEATGRGQDVA